MKRILVIDDDVQFRQMLRQMLERAGYEVLEAANGKKGIESYRSEPADLIITDIIMPEKEGIETILELKRDFPDVKIIAISGGGRLTPAGYLDAAQALGVMQIFTKPFNNKEMLEAIEKLLVSIP